MPGEPRVPQEYWAEVLELYVVLVEPLRAAAARQLGSDSRLAHDIVQEAFHDAALCWAKLRLRSPQAQEAWVRRVIRNKINDHWRSNGRRLVSIADADWAANETAEQDTAALALDGIEVEDCFRIIEAMPEMRRRVAYLQWQSQWSTSEIASHLGIAESTVRVHVCQARRDLRVLRDGNDQDGNFGGGRSR
jgi:RNA polymerase sigma-70 factor (ECF subfamily)